MKIAASRWLFLILLVGFSSCLLADEVQDQIARLKDQNWFVRQDAAKALGQLGDARAVEPLIACLKDGGFSEAEFKNGGIFAVEAVEALVKLGKPAVEPLIACLKDQDYDVRVSAAEALGRLGDARAVEPLIACLKDQDWKERFSAAEALGRLGKPLPLIDCLKDQDHNMRSFAAGALGRLGDARAVEPLIACLKDQDYNMRYWVAEALGNLGDARAVEPLIACLKDQDHNMRYWAAEALSRLGKPLPLIAYLKDQDVEKRRSTVAALDRLGDARAVEPLIACLKDQDYTMRVSTAEALGRLGDARAVEPLIACLKDQDPNMRSFAAEALGSLGGKRALTALVKALPDWDTNGSLVEALQKLGWKPTSDPEQVYFWGYEDVANLKAQWEKTKRVLLADIKSSNQRKIENAVYTFIFLGREEIVPKLIRILNTNGNKEMAETFMNCGQGELEKAAQAWAAAHGYQILTGSGAHKAKWGQW